MPIEIACPGCRFLLRADDEFAGESAPCPYCGANIAVPGPRPTGITETIGHRSPTPDERTRCDPQGGYRIPAHWRLPIPQHGEPRPVEVLELDEDRPPPYGVDWPFGPPGPRMRAWQDFLASIERVGSLLVMPLRRLQPMVGFLSSTVGGLVIFWGVAFWLLEEYPYLALVAGLAGCFILYAALQELREVWHDRRGMADECEDWAVDSEDSATLRHDDSD